MRNEIGTRIQNLRKQEGLTQPELAKKLGISMAAVRNYENGLREPNSKAMAALEQYFSVSGAYLRGEEPNKIIIKHGKITQESPSNKKELNDALEAIQKALQKLSNDVAASVNMNEIAADGVNRCAVMLQAFSELSADGQLEMLKRIDEYSQLEKFKQQQKKATSIQEKRKKSNTTEETPMVSYAIAGRDGTRLTGLMSEEDAKALEALPETYPGE